MTWHNICKLDDLAESAGQEFLVGKQVVAVFRRGDVVHATDGMCAHQGGPIAQGELKGDCVTCPWHGWQYDVTNGVNLLTGKHMLACFPNEIRDGEVWIELPADATA